MYFLFSVMGKALCSLQTPGVFDEITVLNICRTHDSCCVVFELCDAFLSADFPFFVLVIGII